MNYEKIGQLIRQLRTEKGLTQVPKLFLQEADSLQMKTADHKNIDHRLS